MKDDKMVSLPNAPGVYYPSNWSDEKVAYVRRAYEAGKRRGRWEVINPIKEALEIPDDEG